MSFIDIHAFLVIVRATIRYHVDLRVSKEMRSYAGPVRLIRRTEDEIIADPPSSLPANRGNYLLMDILRQRYPFLLDNEESERALRGWLNQPHVKDVSTRAALERSEVSIPEKTENLSSLEKATLILQIVSLFKLSSKISCVNLSNFASFLRPRRS